MTENKRFTKVEHIFELNDEGIKDNQTRIEYYYALDLIDLLNELSEENEQLQERNDRQRKTIDNLYQLILNRDYDGQEEWIKELEESERLLQEEMKLYCR